MTTTRGVWIIPSFQIWGYVLHVEHISCVFTNCGQHEFFKLFCLRLKPYLVVKIAPDVLGRPFSFLSSSSGLTGVNITRKYLSLSLDLFFKLFAIPGYFPCILFYHYLFSLLSSGLFVIAVCGSISVRELVKFSVIVNWCRVAVSNDKST